MDNKEKLIIKKQWEVPVILELSVKESLQGGYTFEDGDLAPSVS